MAATAPILWRLKTLVEKDNKVSFPQSLSFFSNNSSLDNVNDEFFKPLVREHRLLTLEYGVLRAGLVEELDNIIPGKNHDALFHKIQAAYITAMVLEHLYRDYLVVPHEVARFIDDQNVYRDWLETKWNHKIAARAKEKADPSVTQMLRRNVRDLNPFRLLIVRTRRLLVLMALVIGNLGEYGPWISEIDKYAAPFFAQLAWIFFAPRLVVNVYLTCKHVFEHPWMTKKERSLGTWTRLNGQLARRWVELSNDIAWLISGVIGCFVLTGALLPVAIYVALAMQCYDLICATFRAYHEITSLKNIIQQYSQCPGQKDEINRHIEQLKKRLDLESRALYFGILNFSVLLLAICLTLPALAAVSPIIPVVGAALALVITIITFVGNRSLDIERGKDYNDQKKLPSPHSEKSGFISTSSKDDPDSPGGAGVSILFTMLDKNGHLVPPKKAVSLSDLSQHDVPNSPK